MNKPDKNEQWLLSGDCEICRRKNYCKKNCTKRERVEKAYIKRLVKNAVDEATDGAFSKILEHSRYDYFG